ncbi:hypothetical protein EQG41_04515 [Billgrantia azerbaijanica]|nr:hypothetical protein EQG41_04515 [Halomonas azerbaijanica]
MTVAKSMLETDIYIEAFGRPAVGKSYVTERLVKLPEVRRAGVLTELFPVTKGHRLSRVPRKLWLILRYLPTLLMRRRRIAALVRSTPWMSAPAAGRALLNWVQLLAMVQHLHHLHRQGEPILLCQGVFQALWSLWFRAEPTVDRPFPLQEWITLSLALLPPRPIVVLHVVAAPAAIRQRQLDRVHGQSVLDRRRHGFASAQHCSARITEEILTALLSLESEGQLRVVTFDNTAEELTHERLTSLVQVVGLGRDPSAASPRGCV